MPNTHKKPGRRAWLSENLLLLDADLFAVLAHALESDLAVHQGEQGVVGAAAHVLTGVMWVPR